MRLPRTCRLDSTRFGTVNTPDSYVHCVGQRDGCAQKASIEPEFETATRPNHHLPPSQHARTPCAAPLREQWPREQEQQQALTPSRLPAPLLRPSQNARH